MTEISQRFHNDTYAPGIATYGIDGATGKLGDPGTSMFFTDYSFQGTDLNNFYEKITSRKLPVKNADIVLNRKYVNGDIFVTNTGDVYILKNIDEIIKQVNNSGSPNIEGVIELIGKFDKTAGPFNSNNTNELSRGKKITISDVLNSNQGNGLLNLIKGNNGNSNTTSFINMKSLYGNLSDVNLDITYDNQYNAFMLKSKYPIIIDANLYVKNKNTNKANINEYSLVLTSNNAITDFVGLCKDITCDIDASIYSYTLSDSSTLYYGTIYKISLNDNSNILEDLYIKNKDITLHFQNKDFLDFLLYRMNENTYFFKQDYKEVKLNSLINTVKYTDLNNIKVSLINNFEVYIKNNNTKLSGFE